MSYFTALHIGYIIYWLLFEIGFQEGDKKSRPARQRLPLPLPLPPQPPITSTPEKSAMPIPSFTTSGK